MKRIFIFVLSFLLLGGAAMAQFDPPRAEMVDDDFANLMRQIKQLASSQNYAAAAQLAESTLVLAEQKFGPMAIETAKVLNILGTLHMVQKHPEEAQKAYIRYLDIAELLVNQKTLHADDPDVDRAVGMLIKICQDQGRFDVMERIIRRAIDMAERDLPHDHAYTLGLINGLAILYDTQKRSTQAEALFQRTAATAVKILADGSPQLGPSMTKDEVLMIAGDVAEHFKMRGHPEEAEQLQIQIVATLERDNGGDHPKLVGPLHSLGETYEKLGQEEKARLHYERAIAVGEKALAAGPIDDMTSLNLSLARQKLQLLALKRKPSEGGLPSKSAPGNNAANNDPLSVALSLSIEAGQLEDQHRYDEAEKLRKRVIAIREEFQGPDSPDLAVDLQRLATFYMLHGKKAEGREQAERAKKILSAFKTLSLDNDIGAVLDRWNDFGHLRGKFPHAQWRIMSGIVTDIATYGRDHPNVQRRMSSLARTYIHNEDWRNAVTLLSRISDAAINQWRHAAFNLDPAFEGSTGAAPVPGAGGDDLGQWAAQSFLFLIKASYRVAEQEPARRDELMRATFITAQWEQKSSAAVALGQMVLRAAQKTPKLAALVRERQDLERQWQMLDQTLIAAIIRGGKDRNLEDENSKRAEKEFVLQNIKNIDDRLRQEFPKYTEFSNPEPLTLDEAKSKLTDNEALVLFIDTPLFDRALHVPALSGEKGFEQTPAEGFAWVITRKNVRWVRLPIGGDQLANQVMKLRCGLDSRMWKDKTAAALCVSLTGQSYDPAQFPQGYLPPFDLNQSHNLYAALFGQVEDLIQDKHLLIVASGGLTSLPLHILVTKKPLLTIPTDASAYANAEWLFDRHATTTLPAVASLRARGDAKPSTATTPYVGFANPLLTGKDAANKSAWKFQSCAAIQSDEAFTLAGVAIPAFIYSLFRDGKVDVDELRRLTPLPETAQEVCKVAKSFGAKDNVVHLGSAMTKPKIKALSSDGTLSDARVIHFATHGLVAGQTTKFATAKAEPALVLTPPEVWSPEDDGLLTTSDVVELKLDADWVVLSACNTSASNTPGAEALSGLARAFFYAGARTILVSHWSVQSDAAVLLTTEIFHAMRADPNMGRAEALRSAMRKLVQQRNRNAHPAVWAPFVVVGEGG